MKRKRTTPVSQPLPARAAAAVRKGIPFTLAARLAGVRRQRVTQATVRRVAAGEALSRDYLQLTTTCWVVRTLFTFLQIGGKFRKSALGMLFAPAGRKGFRWVETRYASWLLDASRAEHFLRVFDSTSRALILALASIRDLHVIVATIIFLRVVVVEGARARSWLDAVARLGQAAFVQDTMRSHCPDRCPRAYTPLGKDAGHYRGSRVLQIIQRLSAFVSEKPPISYQPEALQRLAGYKENALGVQFGMMQVAMDLLLLLPRSASCKLRSVLPLYKVVGSGCGLSSAHDVAQIAQAIEKCRPLRKLFRQLGFSAKILGWWFLAEHGACAIRKYSVAVGAELAAATDGCAPTREQLVERYSCPAKEAEYAAVLAWLRKQR